MDTDVVYGDERLDTWANWVKGGMSAWPGVTLLGRIIEQGARGAAQVGRSVESMPEAVLQTDGAVARLQHVLRHTVKIYYFTYADSSDKAKRLGVSRATFWRHVTRAQRDVGIDLRTRETQEYISGARWIIAPVRRLA